MTKKFQDKEIIGWSEYVDFPDWGIDGLEAKVDTGARTSALHVEDLKKLKNDMVKFDVILCNKQVHKRVPVKAKAIKWGRVRSSTGEYKIRCFCRTKIRIGHIEKEIDVTLVSRQKMVFRMLIGRKALEDDFIIDVTKRAVLGEKPRKKKRSQMKEEIES
ncbi:MAG: ATP-dependent zinc protease [Candidatus Omnitrophica bacterium]|nr:ATP-dependent zinc protease [Candidatus Omnitrophota bacterium]MCA9415377.1 ATP-dependent zinc protease [Candidatus Omnitrophota bacterium]